MPGCMRGNLSNMKRLHRFCRRWRRKAVHECTSFVFERGSVLDAIRNCQIAPLEHFALEELEVDLLLHLVKEGNA